MKTDRAPGRVQAIAMSGVTARRGTAQFVDIVERRGDIPSSPDARARIPTRDETYRVSGTASPHSAVQWPTSNGSVPRA